MANLCSVALEDRRCQELIEFNSIYGMHEQGILSKAEKKRELAKFIETFYPDVDVLSLIEYQQIADLIYLCFL